MIPVPLSPAAVRLLLATHPTWTGVDTLLPITPTDLRNWLTSLDPDEECGEADRLLHCPLARFFNAHGFHNAYVLAERVDLMTEDEALTLALPPWTTTFIAAVDAHPGPITAKHALAVLASLEDTP